MSTSLTLLSVIGVLLVTQEFRYSTIRVTFAAVTSRARVIVAKAGVLAVSAFVVSAVMVALATLIGGAVLSARSAPIDFSLPGTSHVLDRRGGPRRPLLPGRARPSAPSSGASRWRS